MSKEAMKLALEALDIVNPKEFAQADPDGKIAKAITALKEALAKPDFWEGYVPEPDKRQQALDKKAENARELGLDYEPAQQEPVAYLCENAVGHKYFRWKKPSSTYKPIALYTSPPAQRTWVGLTNAEVNNIAAGCHLGNSVQDAIYRAEAKLRSKNEDRN